MRRAIDLAGPKPDLPVSADECPVLGGYYGDGIVASQGLRIAPGKFVLDDGRVFRVATLKEFMASFDDNNSRVVLVNGEWCIKDGML